MNAQYTPVSVCFLLTASKQWKQVAYQPFCLEGGERGSFLIQLKCVHTLSLSLTLNPICCGYKMKKDMIRWTGSVSHVSHRSCWNLSRLWRLISRAEKQIPVFGSHREVENTDLFYEKGHGVSILFFSMKKSQFLWWKSRWIMKIRGDHACVWWYAL